MERRERGEVERIEREIEKERQARKRESESEREREKERRLPNFTIPIAFLPLIQNHFEHLLF